MNKITDKIGVVLTITAPLISLGINAINDHIAIKNLQKDIQVLKYEIKHGRSRSHDKILILELKVKKIERKLNGCKD